MVLREATEQDRQRFNDFVARFESGDLLQSFEWGELKSRSGWTPIRIFAESEDTIVAAASLLKRPVPRVGRSVIYAPRGPVLDARNLDLLMEFTAHLKNVARRHKAVFLKIDPPVPASDSATVANLHSVGFIPVASGAFGGIQPKCVMQLPLDESLDDLMASFKPKWRYNIRLAERKGVVVHLDCDKSHLKPFYALLQETSVRDRFLVRDLRYFQDMWDILAPAGYLRLVLAYYQDAPVAGAIAFIFGDKAWYVYGASSNQHRNVMPNHLVQWSLIRWAKEAGCKCYDFRGVSPKRGDGSDDHLQGLNRFKEGFGAHLVEFIGEYDLVLSPAFYWLWNVARPWAQKTLLARRRAETAAQLTEV